MPFKIERAAATGFCYGVNKAIETLEKAAQERGPLEALGAIVHNREVQERMAGLGVTVAPRLEDIKTKTAAIGTHGVTPEVEEKIRTRHADVINTTCPFVQRAQVAARKLAKAGFLVVIFGDANHPEVKGILGYAGGEGIATMDGSFISKMEKLSRRIGILSQTTMIPDRFKEFAKKVIDDGLARDSEIRIIDTICHDIRGRQLAAVELAAKADLMLVVGGRTSANTKHLGELCSTFTETRLIETGADINPEWLKGKKLIGVTGGASTAEQTIDEVIKRLKELNK